jgi:hypothetical protein
MGQIPGFSGEVQKPGLQQDINSFDEPERKNGKGI